MEVFAGSHYSTDSPELGESRAGPHSPIVIYPSEVLRKRAALVPAVTDEEVRLARQMVEIMISSGGIGLAAPQVGVLKRIFVTNTGKDDVRVCFNPEIIGGASRSTRFEESCLSLPDVFADVFRPAWVRVRYFDERGERVEAKLAGLSARVFLHELDHLNGILFIDHLNRKKRERLLKRHRMTYDLTEGRGT